MLSILLPNTLTQLHICCFLNINELSDSIEHIHMNYCNYDDKKIIEYLHNPIYKLPKNIKEIKLFTQK